MQAFKVCILCLAANFRSSFAYYLYLLGALGETTATIFPGDGGEGGGVTSLHGQIVGTGAQGTTYVISGQVSGVQATGKSVRFTFVKGLHL